MTFTAKKITLAWMLSLSTFAVSDAAFGQEVETEKETTVDEIVVRGERIARSILNTASSVAVVTSEDIESRNLESIADIFAQVANVAPSVNGRGFRIRGISNSNVTGAGNGGLATIYVDGAPLSNFAASFGPKDTWDIGQVEIFRGAQSASQGRDSLAGAIIIRSNDPIYEYEYKGRVRVEEFGGTTFSAVANIPLSSDQAALRIAVERKKSDGFIHNTTFDIDDYNFSEKTLGRVKLLLEPNNISALKSMFTFVYSENEFGGDNVQGPDVFARENTANILQKTEIKQIVATWEVDYDINDQWNISNVFSFNRAEFDDILDDDSRSTGGVNRRERVNDIDTLTEEVRVFYTTDTLNATAGIYYSKETEDNLRTILTGLDIGALAGAPALNTIYAAPFLIGGELTNKDKTTNYAAFFSADYDVSDFITINAGLRYDRETQDFEGNTLASLLSPIPDPALFGPFGPTIAAVNAGLAQFSGNNFEVVDETYDAWLPSASIIFHWADDFTTILQTKRAYRAGGGGTSLLEGPFSFNPEFAWTFEAGFRKKFMQGRAQISSNVYHMKWSDMQVVQLVPFGNGDFTVSNAANAELNGFEIEFKAQPNDAWNVFANVGYSDTKFTDFVTDSGDDFTGNSFRDAPNWTAAAGAGWHSIRNGFFVQADANFQNSAPTNFANTLFADKRTLVNAKIGYDFEKITISAFARNAFDAEYISEDLSEIFSAGAGLARIGNPRVLGFELKFSN